MTDSIIVYRNPLEAAFWETVSTSVYTFPVMVSLCVYILVAAFISDYVHSMVSFIARKTAMKFSTQNKLTTQLGLILPVCPAVMVFMYMIRGL